jgi:hypothetical protein
MKTALVSQEGGKGEGNPPLSAVKDPPAAGPAGVVVSRTSSLPKRFGEAKNMDPCQGYPGLRYILLHTCAHPLICQLAVECG